MKLHLFDYQKEITKFILEHEGAGVFVDPGLGKTAATLQAIKFLHMADPSLRVLVIAPLMVVHNTWPAEIKQWDQFSDLSFSVLHGAGKNAALRKGSTVDLINPEGLFWLFPELLKVSKKFPYDVLVVDESTKFKNATCKRFKVLRKHLPRFPRRVILTGTPIPKSLEDIFSQSMIIDLGETFGRSIMGFRREYFRPIPPLEFNRWEPLPGSLVRVKKKLAPHVITLEAMDHKADLKPLVSNVIRVDLPPAVQKIYAKFERDFFADLDGSAVFTPTEAQKYLTLRQIANGGLYKPEGRDFFNLHECKLDALEILHGELHEAPTLVGFHFRSTGTQIKKRWPTAPIISGADHDQKKRGQLIEDWNADRVPLLFGQAAAMAHGLNLHKGTGRNIVWLTVPDNLETYEQFNRRIYGRNGVTDRVFVHNLIARGTVEEVIIKRLQKREAVQADLKSQLKEYYQGRY